MLVHRRTFLGVAAALVTVTAAVAQVEPDQSERIPVAIDSGLVANTLATPAGRGLPQVVWSTVVAVPTSSWLRLRYHGVLLSGQRTPGGDGSFLRLTSLRDGAVMTQHLVHVGQWQDTSAYFNGDAVQVELLAFPGTGDNQLQIREVIAGPALLGGEDTICGVVDDRVLSNDPRVARNQPTGCTSWLIDDCKHCFLTAGHCASGLQVVQFNVPLSTSSGSLQHPPPSDQYAVDPASMQTNGGQGVGNDWAYFGVFANSVTGQFPYQANGGQAFDLLSVPPPVAAQQIRVTGNGSTSSPVSPTWYLVQKTHAGPYSQFTGTTVRYATDTTGGNSGSPVIVDGTNQAIGIHTHGGCTSTGGSNAGTGSNHLGLQAALASPQGVCACPGVVFDFPNGLPAVASPTGGTAVRVQVSGPVAMAPGTLQLLATTSTGTFTAAAIAVAPGLFDLPLPAAACGTPIAFHLSALGVDARTYTSPANAPASRHAALAADAMTTLRFHDFNTAPPSWTVVNTSLSTGAWERATPTDPRGPAGDFDGSGQCWVTGNGNNVDVDGGPTTLRTETVNLAGTSDARVSFALWFACDPNDDRLRVDASNDGGANWVNVLDLGPTNGWTQHTVRVRNVFATPNLFALRFVVADNPNNSVTEAALDAYRIDDVQCTAASWTAYGTGCAGGGSTPALQATSLPTLGGTFALAVSGLGSGFPFLLAGLAAENTPLPLPEFAPGCTLLTRVDVAVLLAASGGNATWTLPIPADPALQGVRVHQQAFELGSPWTLSGGGVAEIR
jgi:hypothetical protein